MGDHLDLLLPSQLYADAMVRMPGGGGPNGTEILFGEVEKPVDQAGVSLKRMTVITVVAAGLGSWLDGRRALISKTWAVVAQQNIAVAEVISVPDPTGVAVFARFAVVPWPVLTLHGGEPGPNAWAAVGYTCPWQPFRVGAVFRTRALRQVVDPTLAGRTSSRPEDDSQLWWMRSGTIPARGLNEREASIQGLGLAS